MEQLQNGLVPAFWEQPGGSVPAGNNETPLAREDLDSDAIVNAQLTHLISRDDARTGRS